MQIKCIFIRTQVVEEATTTPAKPQVAAAATESSGLMDMVKGLQATVTDFQRGQASRRVGELPECGTTLPAPLS